MTKPRQSCLARRSAAAKGTLRWGLASQQATRRAGCRCAPRRPLVFCCALLPCSRRLGAAQARGRGTCSWQGHVHVEAACALCSVAEAAGAIQGALLFIYTWQWRQGALRNPTAPPSNPAPKPQVSEKIKSEMAVLKERISKLRE